MAETSNERPAPAAVGTLEARPFVHLLVYARNRRLSGLLEVHAPDGRNGTLSLWRGRIREARTMPAIAYFGAVAYELGLIDSTTLDATLLEISKTRKLHGEVLIERGSLTTKQRDAVLEEQTCRKVHHLFGLPPESTFAFYDARASVEEPPFTLDPIKPAWRGLRERPPLDSVAEVLAKYATMTLRLANEGPVERAGFEPKELALCDALTWKAMTIAQIRVGSDLPTAQVDLLLYLLLITKCVEPTTVSSTAIPAAPPSSSPAMRAALSAAALSPPPSSRPSLPSARTSHPSMPAMPRAVFTPPGPIAPGIRTISTPSMPSVDSGEIRRSLSFRVPSAPAFRTASISAPHHVAVTPAFGPADLGAVGIAHRAQHIESEDAFTLLGLEEGASVEAARAAFFRISKQWHPDRIPEDLAPFAVEAQTIFEHMSRAHRTLTEADLRRDYLAKGPGARVPSTSLPAAPPSKPAEKRPRAEVLREIEQALTRREFESAESAARELSKADADDADAQSLAAWAATFAGEGPEETLRAAVTLLDRAVSCDRHCERAHYFRGLLHKRLGSNAPAFRDFSRVLQLNPKHVDAQREVRIYEMRARRGSGEHAVDVIIASKAKKK